jgi:hypothetical protein
MHFTMTATAPAGFTGIEVHAKLSEYLKEGARLGYKLGFSWWGKFTASFWKVRLTLDGNVVADEDLFAPHVVACLPGQHTFAVLFHRKGLGALDAAFYERQATVIVEPGQVTQLIYVSQWMGQELVALGSWPWVDPDQCPTVMVAGFDEKPHPAHAMYRARGMTMVQFRNGWRHWIDDTAIHAG